MIAPKIDVTSLLTVMLKALNWRRWSPGQSPRRYTSRRA